MEGHAVQALHSPTSGPSLRERFLREHDLDSVGQLPGGRAQGLDSIQSRLSQVLKDSIFERRLNATIQRLLRAHRVSAGGADYSVFSEGVAQSLLTTLGKVVEATFTMYRSHEQQGQLQTEDLTVTKMLRTKKIAKIMLREFISHELELSMNDTNRLLGDLVTHVTRDVGLACIECGQAQNLAAHQKRFLILSELECGFLSRQDTMRLARRIPEEDFEPCKQFLADVRDLPRLSQLLGNAKIAKQREDTFRRAMVFTAVNLVDDYGVDNLQRLSALLGDLYTSAEVHYHLFHNSSGGPFVRSLLEGLRANRLVLRCVSCPDYSGQVEATPKGGEQWVFDFNRLGCNQGIVAQRGIPFIIAVAQLASRHIPQVEVEHFEPSFEVLDGFRGRGSGGEDLSREQALNRLRMSGDHIASRLEANGLSVKTFLMHELLEDLRFAELRSAILGGLFSELSANKSFHDLCDFLLASRKSLYERWHPANAMESDDEKSRRLTDVALLPQMAEYVITGSVLTKEPNSLLLAYDSALMGEVYAFFGLPVLFGSGKGEMSYEGA